MTETPHHRPSTSSHPEEGTAGGASGSATSGNVGLGVEAWLAAQGATRESAARPTDEVSAGPAADHEAVARKILLDQLTGQARSRSDLAAKLAAKGVPTEISERLLDRFEEVGLVDDAAFARAWVQSRQPGKGLARRALGQELRRKGIDDELVRDALDEIDPDDEVEAARMLVRRKLRSVARVDQTTAVRRLTGMLARKGYPAGTAFRVVREELAASRRDELPDATEDWSEPRLDDS